MSAQSDGEDLRAAAQLLIDAAVGVTGVVESMHRTIASGPKLLGQPLALPFKIGVAPIYSVIRGVTRLSGTAVDGVLAMLSPLLSTKVQGPERLALQAALNGVIGDQLEAKGNGLAIGASLCRDGVPLMLERASLEKAIPDATSRLLILMHGSSMNDLQWKRDGHDHGAMLAELGWTPVYVRYNSGRHISESGRSLAELIDRAIREWPRPVTSIALIGHSMGGLVARSACHVAEVEKLGWRSKVSHLVTLASPHHGAALERAGNWVDTLLGISRYSAPLAALGKIRSAGVTDLRYGNVRDEDWADADRFERRSDVRTPLPLPKGVACFAVAATMSKTGTSRPRGDGLVAVESALGIHARKGFTLAFPKKHRLVVHQTDHLGVLNAEPVREALRAWLSPAS